MKYFDFVEEGLWLVKWIDRFVQGQSNAVSSPFVDVALQKLPFTDLESVVNVAKGEVPYLLGKRPGPQADDRPVIIKERVLAGNLPQLSVGQIVSQGHVVGILPTTTETLTLDSRSNIRSVFLGDAASPPKGWTAGDYRLLNNFDFLIGRSLGFGKSECLVIRNGDTEIIIPKMVIFQCFYGFHTKLVNTLCGGPWGFKQQNQVISFVEYLSGIETGRDPETGAWNIVLRSGIDPMLAPRIALLWFDEFARAEAEALYTRSHMRTAQHRGGDKNEWFASANIPHRWKDRPFHMTVTGYELRLYKPSEPSGQIKKFLANRIVQSSWSLPDQLIYWEVENSNAGSDNPSENIEAEPYRKKSPVDADSDAFATSATDPDAASAANIAFDNTFEFFEMPKVEQQRKRTNKTYLASRNSTRAGPDSIISAGNPAYGLERPSIAQFDQPLRSPSHIFVWLTNALQELVNSKVIASYSPLAPPPTKNRLIERSGTACWNLVAEDNRERRTMPKSGWELIFKKSADTAEERRRYPRCLMIMKVAIATESVILMEIEPRPSESAYRIYAFKEDGRAILPGDIDHVANFLRDSEGRIADDLLSTTFGHMTSHPIHAFNHAYEYPLARTGNPDTGSDPIGLKAGNLGNQIKKMLVD